MSIWRLVKSHANYCVDILKTPWLRPAFAESYRLLRVTLSKELVAVLLWNASDQWHNWQVAGGRIATPSKLNVKTEPRIPCFIVFTILLVSVDCCFFASFGVFSGDFGFLHRRSIPDFPLFLTYFLSVSRGAPFS